MSRVTTRVAPRSSASWRACAKNGSVLRLPHSERGVDPAPVELGAQAGEQVAVEVVDRAAPAAGDVVLADLREALVGDVAAGGDAAEEGHDLLGRLGPAEGPEQDDVVGGERAAASGMGPA